LSEPARPEPSPRRPCPEKPRQVREKPFRDAYIGIGSNIQPEANLPRALDLLCQEVRIERLSMVWETPPLGLKGQNFLNAVVCIRTQLSVTLLKSLLLRPIEIKLGRVRTANKYAPRTIDLDILVYECRLVDPAVWEQAFLAVPLAELIPDYTHPDTGEPLKQAAGRLAQGLTLTPRPEVLAEFYPG
jgi:2-amino-4-hydroxy-6-hydroxymethyldihydropteridine diphosphokinase